MEKQETDPMLAMDDIDPTQTEEAQQIVFLLERDRKTPFCVDYQKFKGATICDLYVIQSIE